MENNKHPIFETSEKYETLFQDWFKNILGISTGALAILVSLMPKEKPPSPDKYFLSLCWLLLLLCILCSLIASFRQIFQTQLFLHLYREAIKNKQATLEGLKVPIGIFGYRSRMVLVTVCQIISISSFCLAIISLGIYAILQTF